MDLLSLGVAGRFDQLLDDNQIAAIQLSSDPSVVGILKTPDDEAALELVNWRFKEILNSNPYYEYIYLMDAEGTSLVSQQLDGLPSVVGNVFRDRHYFINAREGKPHIDALVGRVSKKLGFYFTSPVYGDYNQVIGVAAIKVQGEAVTEMINAFNEKSGSVSAFLADFDGVVVSAPEDKPSWQLKGLAELSPVVQEMVEERFVMDTPLSYIGIPELAVLVDNKSGVTSYKDAEEGAAYIVGYKQTEKIEWIVGVSMSSNVFLSSIYDLAIQTGIGATSLAILVVIAAILLARGIARPISKLAAAAQDVEDHKPFAPEDISDVMSLKDEVGHLARVFSDMVLSLRARMAELQTIYEIGHKISSSVELTDTLSDVIDSLGNVVDFDAAEICLYDDRDKDLELYVTNVEIMSDDETVEKITYNPKKDYFPRLFTDSHGLIVDSIAEYTDKKLTTKRSWDAFDPKSYLGVGLRNRGRVVGTIEMISSQLNGFNEDNRRILESISIQAAVAISNAQEVKERERRLMNMEIVVDDSRVDDEISSVTQSGFFKQLKKRVSDRKKE
ncbi:MAG: GAF domain-containing protein [Chloroflexi bacterium]|nr:GAF domain-containing protein [Chloroflexota bacterium]